MRPKGGRGEGLGHKLIQLGDHKHAPEDGFVFGDNQIQHS